MTTLSALSSSPFLPTRSLQGFQSLSHHHGSLPLYKSSSFNQQPRISNKPISSFTVRAAKVPPGVEFPKVKPTFIPPFLGFTKTAEIWNSRACMIGLIGTFIVELILNKGILQIIGVEVGKGLDIPL